MTDIPQPKFKIGEKVWAVSSEKFTEKEICPDCLGATKWKAILPNGEEFEIPCWTCIDAWGTGNGKIMRSIYKYIPAKYTIGSIQIDTNSEFSVRYMLNETGVGSGQIWYESQIFKSEEDCQVQCRKVKKDFLIRTEKENEEIFKKAIKRKRLGYLPAERKVKYLEEQVQKLKKKLEKKNG